MTGRGGGISLLSGGSFDKKPGLQRPHNGLFIPLSLSCTRQPGLGIPGVAAVPGKQRRWATGKPTDKPSADNASSFLGSCHSDNGLTPGDCAAPRAWGWEWRDRLPGRQDWG